MINEKVAGGGPPGKLLRKLGNDPWPKAQRRQVVLVETGGPGNGDRGQEFLQGLQLLAVNGVFLHTQPA